MIKIKLDTSRLVKAMEPLKLNMGKVLAKTMKETGGELKTEASRAIRERYNLSASRVREGLTMVSNVDGIALKGEGRPLGLQHFDARVSKGKARQVSVRVLKAGGRKNIKGGFMAQGLVWRRDLKKGKVYPKKGRYVGTGIKRQPLEKLPGPSVGAMLLNDNTVLAVKWKLRESLQKNFKRAADYYFHRA